jgi:radical SAM enzyme (TIGR01210 family)
MLSVYPEQAQDEWIITQRPPRNQLEPYKPNEFFLERELSASGRVATSAVILLTNRECPWRCLMCDLWKNTLPYSVPPGAIPAQIEYALARIDSRPEQIKLYNSGSFFDAAAIPVEDYPLIAEKVSDAERVIVESHPKLIGERTIAFRNELAETQLEVAMGLETIHPSILPRLNKKMTLELFLEAAGILNRSGIILRAFVLIKPPLMIESDAVEWGVKSAGFAFQCGAAVVSLIPTRAGNGAMERLIENGEFSPPSLHTVEKAFEECLARFGDPRGSSASEVGLQRRVFVDTWNLEQFSRCPHCFEPRRSRLCQMNLLQEIPPAVNCSFCKGVM